MLKSVVSLRALEEGAILSPERYDPRRKVHSSTTLLIDIVDIVRDAFDPAKGSRGGERVLVLDTGDADEGLVRARGTAQLARDVGSAKKRVACGDVLISRLRPYLKQVGWVDVGVGGGASLVCSTEFFVLRPKSEVGSLAFLVPFLLSEPVHRVLCASQEGGHHPRFNQRTLESLPVPDSLFGRRQEVSTVVERAIRAMRAAESEIESQVQMLGRDLAKRFPLLGKRGVM